jgi:predicted MPP superfamily phosphohydrolase
VRGRFAVFVAVVQAILLVAHWFLYETLTTFGITPDPPGISKLQLAFAFLSVSFVAASLLAYRSSLWLVRLFYKLAATWLAFLSLCFFAAFAVWTVYGVVWLLNLPVHRREIAMAIFGATVLACAYGIVNASWIRITRVTVKLANLPESWRGRTAALVSDLHLGHVRNYRFAARVVAAIARSRPDVVLIAGDLYDGTAADFNRLAEPWAGLRAPLGTYFVTGNHDEFARTNYRDALVHAGVRVLDNEKIVIDGLQLVGVHYGASSNPKRLELILQKAALDPGRASILLTHAPDWLPLAGEAGVSLQLSGHTHGGQFFPFTRLVRRIYGAYSYRLHQLGSLTVYTSSGAGTWGPPVRLGTNPEVVLIRFA